MIVRAFPVQARRALRCATFQSVVPVRCSTAREVHVDFGEMSAVIGVADVRRWYRKGMPMRARRSGERSLRVETVVEGSPDTATRVPRRV